MRAGPWFGSSSPGGLRSSLGGPAPGPAMAGGCHAVAGGDDRPPDCRRLGRASRRAGGAGRRRRVPPPGVARPRRADPFGRRGAEFLEDPSPEKRRRLVDRLLAGPAYVAHFTTIERRLMIPRPTRTGNCGWSRGVRGRLRRQVAGNVGYDQVVRELLTVPVVPDRSRQPTPVVPGLGPVEEPSPLPFYLAKEVKGENLAASTARLFLGLRLECAQCHNHPFATWTREQFWGYAAFFSGLETQGPPARGAGAGSAKFPTATRRRSPVPARSCRRPSSTVLAAWRPGVATRAIPGRLDPPPRTPFSPGRRSTACGPTSSASAWSSRSTTWGRTTHRVTPSFSTPWQELRGPWFDGSS